jgi:hypothetical protein
MTSEDCCWHVICCEVKFEETWGWQQLQLVNKYLTRSDSFLTFMVAMLNTYALDKMANTGYERAKHDMLFSAVRIQRH